MSGCDSCTREQVGASPDRIDAARDAARRCLTAAHVTGLELAHLWPAAEAGGDWATFSTDAAGVFAALRRDAEAAETALDAEALDCIKLAAGALPGFLVAGGVASTAHEGALQTGNAVYAALWAGGATGGPVDADILNPPPGFRTRQELWLQKLLTDLPDAQQRRFWAAVIEAVGQVDIPRDLAAGIEREWAAARRAAAGEEPQGPTGTARGGKAADATKRPTISDAEADAVARKLAKKSPGFVLGTAKEWAAAIERAAGKTCSATRVKSGLPFWREAKGRQGKTRNRARGKSRPGARHAAKAVGFSAAMERTQADEKAGEPLDALIAEEERAEAEKAVLRSGLGTKERTRTLELLRSGELLPEQARQIAEMYPPRPTQEAVT